MNEETILTYTVSVPKELNNSYALSKTQTKWIFSAYMSSSSGGGGGGGGSHKPTGGGSSNYGPGHTQATTGQGQTENQGQTPGPGHLSISDQIIQLIPKLGDSNFWQGVFVTAAAGLVGTAVFGKSDKNKKKDRKKKEGSYEDIQ